MSQLQAPFWQTGRQMQPPEQLQGGGAPGQPLAGPPRQKPMSACEAMGATQIPPF